MRTPNAGSRYTGLRLLFISSRVPLNVSVLLGVAESQLVCRHADIVLLSVLRDVSSGPKILAACETLADFGVQSLYAVVAGAGGSDYGRYYSNYDTPHTEG